VFQEIINKLLINTTGFAHRTIFIVLLLAIRVVSASVEIETCINTALVVGWDKADIGDSANILTCSQLGGVVEKKGIEERNQGSALASCCLIRNSEVCD
jgi:hypothetical protein